VLVTAWLTTCVALLVTVIFTLGTEPPLASVTVPVMELRAWPRKGVGEPINTMQMASKTANQRQPLTLAWWKNGSIGTTLIYGSL
jgi:hypothetical protein